MKNVIKKTIGAILMIVTAPILFVQWILLEIFDRDGENDEN